MNDRTIAIPKYRFREPKRNLPTLPAKGASPEDRFTKSFAQEYFNSREKIHRRSTKSSMSLVREIPVNGYGITDLLAISWNSLPKEIFPSAQSFAEVAKPTCRAFEMKLSNWQKALGQASRYRNFAHQSIVVLPPDIAASAIKSLKTFKLVGVGLWSFDHKTNHIMPIYTPRSHNPRSYRYWIQSIEKAAKAIKSTLPIR